jgi:hypothetical protein
MSGKKSSRPLPAIGIRRTVSKQIFCAIGRRKTICLKRKKAMKKKNKILRSSQRAELTFFAKRFPA